MTGLHTVCVAAFDVDGTLTDRDCVVPFLRRVRGTSGVAVGMLRRPHHLVPALVARDRDRLKALAAHAAFAGLTVAEVEAEAAAFAAHVAGRRMRPDILRRLADHQAAGDVVVLVSASFEVYLLPLAVHLGGAAVVATRLRIDGDRYTGDLDGPNCRGSEKRHRLHAWLDLHHGGRDRVHVTAYGDSTGDRELLLDADEAHWAGPGAAPAWFRS